MSAELAPTGFGSLDYMLAIESLTDVEVVKSDLLDAPYASRRAVGRVPEFGHGVDAAKSTHPVARQELTWIGAVAATEGRAGPALDTPR